MSARLIRSTQNAWRWYILPQILPATTSSRQLRKQGYELLDGERPALAGCIAGQLGRLIRLEQPDGLQLWAHAQDIAFAKRCPVALGLTPPELILELFNLGTLELSTSLVPPGLGSVGLLAEGESWHAIQRIETANDEYQRLETVIKQPWGFPDDSLKATLLWICRISGGYELQYHVWSEALSVDKPRAWWWISRLRGQDQEEQGQQPLATWLKMLKETNLYNQAHQTVDDGEYAHQLDILRPIAQQLATQYFQTIRPAQRTILLTGFAPERVVPLPASASVPIAVKNLTVPSDPINWALLSALRGDFPFQANTQEETQAIRHLALTLSDQREGTLTLVIPRELEQKLGDHLATTWLVVLSLVAQTHPGDLTLPLGSTPDRPLLKEILTQSQRLMSNYDFTAEQYRTLQRELISLSQIQIGVSIPFPHRARKSPVLGPLLHLTTLQNGSDADRQIMAVALGNWLHLVPHLMKQALSFPASLLKCSPYAQRLGLVIMQAFSTVNPLGLDIEIGTLLQRAGIALSKHNPSTVMERVEEAFQQLIVNEILADQRYSSLVPRSTTIYCYQPLGPDDEIRLRQQAIEGRWRGQIAGGRWQGWREAYETLHIRLIPPGSITSPLRPKTSPENRA